MRAQKKGNIAHVVTQAMSAMAPFSPVDKLRILRNALDDVIYLCACHCRRCSRGKVWRDDGTLSTSQGA